MRFFINESADYRDGPVQVKIEDLKSSVHGIISQILENFPATNKNANDGVYLGTAGISYMFYHLSKNPVFALEKDEYLSHAINYLQPALNVASKCEKKTNDLPAFILGNAGVYAVAAVIYHAVNNAKLSEFYREKYLRIASICKYPFLNCGDNELFVGRAGYLCGALWLAKETGTTLALKDLYDVCGAIVRSGRAYAVQNNSSAPLMYSYYDTEYLGAAHGLCSILQMLMCVPGYLDAFLDASECVKGSVEYLLSIQTPRGNFPCATDEIGNNVRSEEHELVHWCHGAPGVVYAVARAYIIWDDEKYLQACIRSAELVWEKGLLRKGPGLCHGVAGNGYVFLLLYRLTDDLKYLHRAKVFADFLSTNEFKNNARRPDNPFSLYEGIAGTACFLADLMQPKEAVFPFNNIFG